MPMSPLELPARIPPHNLDAERAVLGAILLEGRETLPRVIEVLRPSDFYTEAHRAAYATMLRLFDRGEPVDLITLSEELRRTDQLYERKEHVTGVATGFEKLDLETSGLQPSDFIIIAGRPSMGKTAFALNVAQHVGIHLRGRVLVLSLEMSAQQIVQRMLCSEAKVDSQAVRTGYLSSSDWHRLTAAAGRLSEAQIFIDDRPGLSLLEARAKARRMKAEHGLELLIIDYLQLMRGRAAMESRQQEISEISRSLKALAKELNVPVVALSQLSRAVESRATRDFRPQLSDLRECVTGDTLV